MDWLDIVYLHNPIRNWLLALLVATAVIVLFYIVKTIVLKRITHFARRTNNRIDDIIAEILNRTQLWFLLIVGLYIGSFPLLLGQNGSRYLNQVVAIAFFIQAAIWGSTAIRVGVASYKQQRMDSDAGGVTVLSTLGLIGKLALWTTALLLILDNLGIEVTSLIAGLGITGIAVALAVQNILSDLFASLSIVLDKPFVIGDAIVVGEFNGTVEKIGLKTTRVRSLSGEQLVFSNSDLLSSRIRNFKRMQERRIVFSIGVLYETPPERLARIPAIIQEIVEQQEQARFDRAHFKALGDFALIYEIVYYMLVPDFAVYMDTQQAINLELVRQFSAQGIQFAYPTQTLFVKKEQVA